MSAKSSPRTKRFIQMEDVRETIAQVHRIIKSDTSSDKDNLSNRSSSLKDYSEDGESNKAFQMDDVNDNHTHTFNTPNREISVEGETQINSTIINLIETELKKDLNKHSHFSESRPQSLSFYEDEKIPEELSGNLELLSPEEKKHYRRRKEHSADSDERRTYNVFQEYIRKDDEETKKKSKSRRKKHQDSELGMGDSKEIILPKEKKRSKKKRRDPTSPQAGSSRHKKREHKKREEHDVKNDVAIALEELQDDVFENTHEDYHKATRHKENLDPSDKLYVQKKNKFEVTNRTSNGTMNSRYCNYEPESGVTKFYRSPLRLAIKIQKMFMIFFAPCHGLLAGLSLCHWLYLYTNSENQTDNFFLYYTHFSDVYVTFFYGLITLCLVSAYDKVDIAHIDKTHLFDCTVKYRYFGFLAIFLYCLGLVLHISIINIEYKIGNLSEVNYNLTSMNIDSNDIEIWNNVSLWRTICVVIPWLLIASFTPENMLYEHLSSMQKYLPNNT